MDIERSTNCRVFETHTPPHSVRTALFHLQLEIERCLLESFLMGLVYLASQVRSRECLHGGPPLRDQTHLPNLHVAQPLWTGIGNDEYRGFPSNQRAVGWAGRSIRPAVTRNSCRPGQRVTVAGRGSPVGAQFIQGI